jgi:hypothetical protein
MRTDSAAAKGDEVLVSSHYRCVLSGRVRRYGRDISSGAIERRKFAVARWRSRAGAFGSSWKMSASNCLLNGKRRCN